MEEREPANGQAEEDMDEELTVVGAGEEEAEGEAPEQRGGGVSEAAEELNNRYLRLYAEFDNYRKRVNKDKEELARYGNESLLYALLPVIDSLELALKHGACDPKDGIVQGVELTMKELQRTLEKFGLKRIPAAGGKFDPAVHHAMMQVEREDMEENMVAEELRAGYLFHDKVLRPSLVAVSARPKKNAHTGNEEKQALHHTNEQIEEEK